MKSILCANEEFTWFEGHITLGWHKMMLRGLEKGRA